MNEMGLTQQQFSKYCECSQELISSYLAERRLPSTKVLKRLTLKLGCKIIIENGEVTVEKK
jgi:transcriptional regulator with XRE-family HTH domain